MTNAALSGNLVIDNLYHDTIKANFRRNIYGRTKVIGAQRDLRAQSGASNNTLEWQATGSQKH